MEEEIGLMNDLPTASNISVPSGDNPNISSAHELPVNLGGTASGLPVYVPNNPSTRGSGKPEFREQSLEEIMDGMDISDKSGALDYVSARDLPGSGRYDKGVYVGRDAEEMYAQQQSTAEKWGNGVAKMVGTAATTFVSGTVGTLNGIGAMFAENRLAAFYDNDTNRKMDEYNKKMEDYLPNYYTQAETSASWLSPKNVWTANFWSDKVIKNLGFSIGSMAGGAAWSKAFGFVGKINALVRAEKGLETLTAVEAAMVNANSVSKFGAVSKALNGLATKYVNPAGAYILANGERATIALMGTMGEASMEALQNMNDFRNKLIKEYKLQSGVEPSGEDLEEINNMADHVGNFTWGMNVALLSATNYIQLPKILNSSKTAERRAINELAKESVAEGATIAEKTAAKYGAKASNLERAFGKPGKLFGDYLVNPVSLLFAPSEAFEEGMQFAIQTGVEDYFNRAHQNEQDTNDFWNNTLDSMGNVFSYGVKQALTTKEGLEGILIGGISGGLQTSFSPFGENNIKERGFTGTGGQVGRNTAAAITEINNSKNLTQALKDARNFVSIGIGSQKNRQEAVANNDTFNEKNFEKDYALSYIMPRVKYGKIDAVLSELDLYRRQALSDAGFEDLKASEVVLENETKQQFIKRLDNIESTSRQVSKTYDIINDRYSNITDEKGRRLYDDKVVDELVYAAAKTVDADERLKDLSSEMSLAGLGIDRLRTAMQASPSWEDNNTKGVIKDAEVQKEINALFAEAKIKDPNNLQNYREKVFDFANLLVDRKRYIDDYNKRILTPEEFSAPDVDTTEYPPIGSPKEVMKVTTSTGDVNVNVGEEYIMGRVTLKSKKGHDVYEAPTITILGQNEDGTLKVKKEDGTIVSMDPEELESRSLTKAEDVRKNPKISFYIYNWNVVWKNRSVKGADGKAAVGRIVYDKKQDRLLFQYIGKGGVLMEQEVINTMFSYKTATKLGFKQPYITAQSVLTPAQEASMEKFIESKMSFSEKIKARNSIISNLYETSKARLEQVTKELTSAKEKVDKAASTIEEQVKKGIETKEGTWKVKAIKSITKMARDLGALDASLLQQIEDLENEKEELEATIPYFKDFLEDIMSTPESGKEMIEDIKKDINDLEDLIDTTKDAISKTKSAIKLVEDLLKNALGVFNDYVKRLKEENPNMPLFLDDFLAKLEKYLGEEGAKQFVADKLGFTEQVLELDSDISDFKDELKIPDLQKRASTLSTDLKELEKGLDDLIAAQMAKAKILDEFKEFADREKAVQAEEKRMHTNPTLVKDLIGTLNKTVQNFFGNKAYDPMSKKPDMAVVRSTRPISDGKPHQERANHFGARMDSFSKKKRDSIRGIIVTQKTQGGVIDGLVEHLLSQVPEEDKEKYPANEVIALVMVEVDKKGNQFLLDQDGKRLSKDADVINSAIYQVFPTKSLKGNYVDADGNRKFGSMFRDDTPQSTVDSLTKQYAAWVDDQLAADAMPAPYKVSASFGYPELQKVMGETKEEIDHNARTSAKAAGLVTDVMLEREPVIQVKTSDAPVTLGNVTFTSPKGRVFLTLPNGIAKLFNRKFTATEAETIYDVLLQVTKNVRDHGEVRPETERLFNWLRSTTYWGFSKDRQGNPKPAGYNNMWFQEVTDTNNEKRLKLYISGKTTDPTQAIDFTYSSLYNRKGDIMMLLQNMYNNTSNHLTNESNWQNPYSQIVGINEDGSPQTVDWPNYQSYLLSDKMPDGGVRKNEDIPLITKFRPLVDENDTNRKGIYFTLKSGPTSFTMPEKEEATPATSEEPSASTTPTDSAPTVTPTKEEGSISMTIDGYEFDGKTPNTMELNAGPITFTVDIEKQMADGAGVSITSPGETVEALIAAKGYAEDHAYNVINATVLARLKPSLEKGIAELKARQTGKVEQKEPSVEASAVITPTPKVGKLDLTGENWNPINTKYGPTRFKINADKFLAGDVSLSAINVEMDPDLVDAVIEAKQSQNYDEEAAHKFIQQNVLFLIKDELALYDIKKNSSTPLENPPVEDTTEEAPAEEETIEEIDEVREATDESVNAPTETEIADGNNTTIEEAAPKKRGGFGKVDPNRIPLRDRKEYRLQVLKEAKAFEGENWEKVEKWLAANFPGLPVYRVKNMIKASNGRQAWGALMDGSIYLTQNAEVGTVYHEVFEAVWKMFAGPKEKNAIIKEFRNRPGYYKDRFTGKLIKFSRATDAELKEELAEEFRDKVLYGKDPVRIKGRNLISRLFNELLDFIHKFFTGKEAVNNTKQLFDKIGNGYYKNIHNPYLTKLSFPQEGIIDIEDMDVGDNAELRINNIPAIQVHDIIQHMTYSLLAPLSESNDILFSLSDILSKGKTKIYAELQEEVLGAINEKGLVLVDKEASGQKLTDSEQRMFDNLETLYNNVETEWKNIVEEHVNYLKTYALEFDENDELNINEGEQSGKEDWQDARTIDSFRKSNSAIKLLLGTLPVKTMKNGYPETVYSSIGGYTLLPANAVHIDLMNRLHDSVDIDEMMERLQNIALNDPKYFQLFERLTGKQPSANQDVYSDISDSDFRLISSFWRVLKKQNADVITVFIQPGGEVIVSDSTLASATKEAKRDMMSKIIDTMKTEKTPYFSYNSKTGRYSATKVLKDVTFSSEMSSYTNFLKNLGIKIDPVKLSDTLDENQKKMFRKTVGFIKETIEVIGDKVKTTNPDTGEEMTIDTGIMSINTSTLNIDADMTRLGIIQAILENPVFESTYFNINGQRTQSYVGTNTVSSFYDVLSKVVDFSEDLQEPQNKGFRYLLTDKFAKNSQILKKLFVQNDDGSYGERKDGTEGIMKTVFIDGTIDEYSGKKKESSKLNYVQRFVQELNLNLEGIYLNLVPGDASIEHAVRLHSDDNPFVNKDSYENGRHLPIFRDYFIDEVELARDERLVANVSGRNSTDLRFFKSILEDKSKANKNALHDEIMYDEKNKDKTSEELYKSYESQINTAVNKFIVEQGKETQRLFNKFNIIQANPENGLEAPGLNFKQDELKPEFLAQKLEVMAVNYMIANIEFHKLIYSDPYQYSDELKRIKNFNSPRQALVFNSQTLGKFLQDFYNKGVNPKDKAAYTDFQRDHFRTVTIDDIFSTNKNKDYEDPFEETDGGGYITIQALRKFRLRLGDWTPANERQFQFDLDYERKVKAGASAEDLRKFLKRNPNIKNTYTPVKPIVSGNKENGRDFNDVVLHKFALVPLSYRVLHELQENSYAIKLLDKMVNDDIDYAVYASGSKVGTETVHELYNEDGTFNNTPFESQREKEGFLPNNVKRGVSNIPFSIVGLQTEVPSKDTPLVTQGSQITKLVTMDFMEAGMPVDFMPEAEFMDRFAVWTTTDEEGRMKSELYRMVQHNQNLLEAKIVEGYNSLLKKLGIVQGKEGDNLTFTITDRDKFIKTLKDEILKREVNYNITDSFDGFESGHVVLEATPAYQQIRNILYSIADKNVVRPKISGGMKVQIPSSLLLEQHRVNIGSFKNKAGEIKQIFESSELEFYTKSEDGKSVNVAEIMVGRWFKSDKTDEELIEYFNNDPEGKKQLEALAGIAFRIPTQKQNSIDVFKIKKFLPKDFGDSVVVPSALVKKVGSDFDIDKLSIYLKNLYPGKDKNLKTVPYLGTGDQALDKFRKLFDEGEFDEYVKTFKDFLDLDSAEDRLLESIFPEDYAEQRSIQKEDVVNKLYKESLENEYIRSLEGLVSHPSNYEALVKPNSAQDLKDITNDINERKGLEKTDYTNVGNMLNRGFMSKQRHEFVTGKQAIGIAAVAQTNHSQNQRSPLFLDFRKLKKEGMDELDRTLLGGNPKAKSYANNPRINFKHYNSILVDGIAFPTLSLIKAAGQATEYISDTIGMFIDGYVDVAKGGWIMEMGATPNTAGTWLYLIKIGVPIKDVAYFMNQPIIVDYLQRIENKGQTWLFSEGNILKTLELYESPEDTSKPEVRAVIDSITSIPNLSTLKSNIGKTIEDMTPQELYEQHFMLKEFVKYAKQASQLFEVTQGSNHDTANINDPYLVFKKQLQLESARNTIISGLDREGKIIPAVDSIMKTSFVGKLKSHIDNYRDAFAEMLLSDRNRVREVMEDVLRPYSKMSDRDFVKISQKAVNDLFDWAVQNDRSINNKVVSTLLGTDTEKSAAKQIIEYRDSILGNPAKNIPAKPDHPLFDNIILNSVTLEAGENNKKVDNIYLGKISKTYDQNLVIYGFNELRTHLKNESNPLYGKIVRLAVLQSGLTNSKIAFTALLPYKDFKEVYNATLSQLEEKENLSDFKNIDVFERNNWNNRDAIPMVRGEMRESKNSVDFGTYDLNAAFVGKQLKRAINAFQVPHVVNISATSQEGRSEFIVYTWESYLPKPKRIRAKKTGDKSHINKYLMKKVYTVNEKGERVPYINVSEDKNVPGKFYYKFVYKAINAWGDSFKAQELYDEVVPSKLDNDFKKIELKNEANTGRRLGAPEVEDSLIVDLMEGRITADQLKAINLAKDIDALGISPDVNAPIEPLAEEGPRYYEGEITPSADTVFVFGSNPEGRHGDGAAAEAMAKFGAKYYQGRGLQGGAYALVTKNLKSGFKEPKTGITYDVAGERSVRPDQIVNNIIEMYTVARANPTKKFKIGFRNTISKSRNGYTGYEMMDMFKNAGEIPANVYFSKEWVDTGKMDADYTSLAESKIINPNNAPGILPEIDRTTEC
jgi:hypothetical protein